VLNDEVRHPLIEGAEFSISYWHSVNQSMVSEIFEIRQGKITLIALEFESFGAGMPTELEPGQSLTRLPRGKMRIDGFNRSANTFDFLIGQDTNHVLYITYQSFELRPGLLHLSVEERN